MSAVLDCYLRTSISSRQASNYYAGFGGHSAMEDMNVAWQDLALAILRPPKSPLRFTVQSWQAANPVQRLLFGARNVHAAT